MIPNRIRASIVTTTALAYGALGWIFSFEMGMDQTGRLISSGATWTVGLAVGIHRAWPRRSDREMTK